MRIRMEVYDRSNEKDKKIFEICGVEYGDPIQFLRALGRYLDASVGLWPELDGYEIVRTRGANATHVRRRVRSGGTSK